jgi:hypothetical protein
MDAAMKILNADERKENKGAEILTTMAFIHRTHASTQGIQITMRYDTKE